MKLFASTMSVNFREKADLTFTRINHTGITSSRCWQQHFIVMKQNQNLQIILAINKNKLFT
ncbi:hypothetical protein AMR41_24100 [Hapalosiphon sp. MRB220]|nr:hypothetical protein AMR41_24100 [Hapalosiphon sp. MRB220]